MTSLGVLALEDGFIDKSSLTTGDADGFPRGIIAGSPAEVLACAGSRYQASASLEAFNRCAKDGVSKLGVVGLPCQVQSLAQAKASPLSREEHRESAALVLGLFCTWALSHRPFKLFLREEGLAETRRTYDIPPPPANVFQVFTPSGTREYPLDRVRPFVQAGCALCPDMTAERADLSVGAVEGMDGWNTLIVRSSKGKDLVDRAIEKGVVEIAELPPENLDHLIEASLNKRKRGYENQKRRTKGSEGLK